MAAGNMYEPTPSSLHRLSRHSIQDRYESDEEAVSESDTGAQDLLSSPVGSRAGIFDSDLSADDNSLDPDSDRDEHTLAPPIVKRPRPISSATIKRNSSATFDEDTYVFDPEDQMIFELPPSDSPPQLASSTFLQPSIYVWPKPQPATRSRSTSPSSVYSVDEADIEVAKRVTFMEPRTRPTLVFINALGSRSKLSRSRASQSRSRESSRTRSVQVKTDIRLTLPRSSDPTKSPRVFEKSSVKQTPKSTPIPDPEEDTQFAPSATINHVSEIPSILYFPAPPRTLPAQEYRTRPQTSGSEKPIPPPLNLRARRPPSMRSTSGNSVYSYTSRPATPFSAENTAPFNINYGDRLTGAYSPASVSSASPPPYISTKRRPSTYSVSNMLTSRSPLMMRRMTRKHSASSVTSFSSLRSEVDVNGPSSSLISVATQPTPLLSADSHIVRKSSQRRHLRHNSVVPSGRGFMGLKLGKKSHAKA
ncbi:hypothetical protein N7491_000502 [Penicillium cf. griseofulvum]|uniref:Uncharacterized protein n=1 Tax=Penicillium cf. griseofulvum TaxID=2972120 RepID=A0A9W9JM41_9EURO|nr:hypothetical protein N7472_004136 [Penicillium cf. griseofulvum]KAJ5451320.1 hypothetical protein N7491_000502 [Penicillium cf. griseofulvum]